MTGHCGTVAGYWRHRRRGERVCLDCYDAHAAEHAASRLGAVLPRLPLRDPLLYAHALAGREPAEALHTTDRRRLITHLHRLGWDDAAIATHTRMTTYTTARIRTHLGLAPNRPNTTRGAA